MPITEKLFAQIQNDAYLTGTRTLEGMDFRDTIGYLFEYVEAIKSNKISVPVDMKKSIYPLLSRLEFLKNNSIELSSLAAQLKGLSEEEINTNHQFKSYTQKVASHINSLSTQPNQDSLMITGGWNNTDGGHAMVYEFKKDKNGDLLFIIHNSGAGLDHHNSVQQMDKERYCPIKVYRIPQKKINEQKLQWFIGELAKPRLLSKGRKDFSAKSLYEETLTKAIYLGGELEDPYQHTKQDNLTAGQHSGTCTEKVLHQIVEHVFSEKKDYQQFIYHFKKHALNDYTHQVLSKRTINQPGVRNQISIAIENMSRSVIKDDYFLPEQRREELKFLREKKEKFVRKPFVENQKEQQQEIVKGLNALSEDETVQQIHLSFPKAILGTDIASQSSKLEESTIKPAISFDFETNSFSQDLTKFIEGLKVLRKEDPKATLQSIELFLISFPLLTDPTFSHLQKQLSLDDTEEKKILLNKFQQIHDLFVESNKAVHQTRITPQFSTGQLSFIAILASLNTKPSESPESSIDILDILAPATSEQLKDMQKNPYFVSENCLYDQRFRQVQKFLESRNNEKSTGYYSDSSSLRTKNHYDNLLKKYHLKNELETFYEEYCTIYKISSSEKVEEASSRDIRALYLMGKYLSANQLEQDKFIDAFCKFHQIKEKKEEVKSRFQKMTADLYYHQALEQLIAHSWVCVSNNSVTEQAASKNPIAIENKGYSSEPIFSLIAKTIHRNSLKSPDTTNLSTYSTAKIVLDNYKLDENKIQMSEYISRSSDSKDIKLIRELFHTRSSDFQILSTIEFFNHHLHLLKDDSLQVLVEKNIFQPSLFENVIKNEPDTLKRLQDFLTQGKQVFLKKEQNSLAAYFFTKLELKTNIYLFDYYKMSLKNHEQTSSEYKLLSEKMSSLKKKINELINENSKILENPSISSQTKAVLHQQKLIAILFLFNQASTESDKHKLLKEMIISHLSLKHYGESNTVQNRLDSDMLENASRTILLNLSEISQKNPTFAKEFILNSFTETLSHLSPFYSQKIKEGKIDWEISLPVIRLSEQGKEIATINVETGKLSRPGLDKANLPSSVLFDETYLALFGKYEPIALSNPENTYFEFDYKGVSYRIIKSQEGKNIIQRQYDVLGQGKRWYQACAVKELKSLQTILQQGENMAWVSVEKEENIKPHILIGKTSTQSVEYCYQSSHNIMIKLDENGNDSGYRVLSTNSFLHKMISSFENPEFIIGLQYQDKYQIQLPRYDLTLEVIKNKDSNQWEVQLQGTDYKLTFTNDHPVVSGLRTGLVFTSEKDKKIIVPIQPYIAEADLKPLSKPDTSVLAYTRQNTVGTQAHIVKTTSVVAGKEDQFKLGEPEKRFVEKKKSKTSSGSTGREGEGEFKLRDPEKKFAEKKKSKTSNDGSTGKEGGFKLKDPEKRFAEKKKSKNPRSESNEPARFVDIEAEPTGRKNPLSQNEIDISYLNQDETSLNAVFDEQIEYHEGEQSEYYNLTPDIGDYLRQDHFAPEGAISIIRGTAQKIIFHQYNNTAKFAEFSLENDSPIPKSMAEGLYLSYTYLCNNLPENAFETLEYCESHFGELSGSEAELDYLRWMVFSVPAKFKKESVDAEKETPEYLAVKLKALSLLAQFAQNNPGFYLKQPTQISHGANDETYNQNIFHRRLGFYINLKENIHSLYHQYLHTQNNVPVRLQLNAHDKLVLLRMIYTKKPGSTSRKATGPLGVSWRKMEIDLLIDELKFLESKAKEYKENVPSYLTDEIKKTKDLLEKEKKIFATNSKIMEKEIIVTAPNNWTFKEIEKAEFTKAVDMRYNITPNIDELIKLPINELNLMLAFPRLCDKIILEQMEENDLKKLIEFSEQTIKANYYNQDKKPQNITTLCSYIYLITKNSAALKKLENEKCKYKPWTEQTSFDDWSNQMTLAIKSLKDPVCSILTKENTSVEQPLLSKGKHEVTLRFLAKEQLDRKKEHSPIILKPLTENNFSVEQNLTSKISILKPFYEEIKLLDKAYENDIKKLLERFENTKTIPDYEQRSKLQLEIDNEAGELASALEKEKMNLTIKYLGNQTIRDSILKESEDLDHQLDKLCKDKLGKLCTFANKNFEIKSADVDSHVNLQLGQLGKKKSLLTINDLLRLYLNSDLEETIAQTGLSANDCHILHNKIKKYLNLSIQKQQYQRICNALKDDALKEKLDIDGNSSTESQQAIALIGQFISESNLINPDQNPALTLFQYDQDILIRKIQKDNIESLLTKNENKNYVSRVIQLIMGGGKSKVLLPILALKRATGENLSIIEVPEALYKTNLTDLNKVSLRLFGQHAFGFHFDRSTPCDSSNLKLLFRQLKSTSVKKGYVVTTAESMASLTLKYHELLSNPPENNKAEWEKQVKWLDQIINFIANRGDALIDEIDSSLDIRKQTNYTIGEQVPVPEQHINCVLELYSFMNKLPFGSKFMLDYAINPDQLSKDKSKSLVDDLAKNLVNNVQSPLYKYFPDDLNETEKAHIENYLLNKTSSLPVFVLQLKDPAARRILNILKGELTHLLPHTMPLKRYENYGPSESLAKSPLQQMITIPYGGNNEPKEKSKDTNHIKTINLTIQNALIGGLTTDVLGNLFKDWLEDANVELLENPSFGNIDNTETGQAVNKALIKCGLSLQLSSIDLENKEETLKLLKTLNQNREFIFYVLKQTILPQIVIENKILKHNPINHVSIYRTVQGVTGTPSSCKTFHQSIRFDETLSLGTDGLTIARLRSKKTAVQCLDYISPSQFLENVINTTRDPEKVRAIIDVGATFRGVNNKAVAIEIAQFTIKYNKKHDCNLKYVLYFDKNPASGMDELYALSIDNPQAAPQNITGKSPSEIAKILKCTPNECFTYYDQKHTIGADIKQDSRAKALVTFDKNTIKKDLVQGVMRMRGFAGAQTVDIIVSNETKDFLLENNLKLSIDGIIELSQRNQNERLLPDHFSSTLQKLENIISQDLKTRVRKIESKNASEKARLHKIFEPFFAQVITEALVEAYGKIETEEDAFNIFNAYKIELIQEWKNLLTRADIKMEHIELQNISATMDQLIKNELMNCRKRQLHSKHTNLDQTSTSQQQSESQQQQRHQQDQNQQQQQEMKESFELGYANSATPFYWSEKITLKELLALEPQSTFETPYYDSYARKNRRDLYTYAMPNSEHFHFDSTFRRSSNFYKTHHFDDASRQMNEYQKQVHVLMMIQTQGKLQSMIVTYKEAEDIKKLLETNKPTPPDYIWFTNTHESKLGGGKPDQQNLHPSYARIMQQARFYNGNFNYLINEDLSGSWLMENYEEKLNYFSSELFRFRILEKEKITILRNKLKTLDEAHLLIATSKPGNLNDIQWRKNFPQLNAKNIVSLKAFANFFERINQENFKPIEKSDQFFTSPYYFRMLMNHANTLQFKNYILMLNDEQLYNMLNEYINDMHHHKRYEEIIKLFEAPAFQTNESKKSIFVKCLAQAFTDQDFTKGLYEMPSSETLEKSLRIISVEDRKNLIKALSKERLTDIFSKDLAIIKLFFEGLPEAFLNKEHQMLSAQTVEVESDGYKNYFLSYDYLVNEPEKFNYFLKMSSLEYKIALLKPDERGLLTELLVAAFKNPILNLRRLNDMFSIIQSSLNEKEISMLWQLIVKISCQPQTIENLNLLAYFSARLPQGSFFTAMKDAPELFLTFIASDLPTEQFEFISKEFSEIKSLDEKYKLLTSDLINRRGFRYQNPMEILESKYTDSSMMPDLYYQFKECEVRYKLIEQARRAERDEYHYLDEVLDQYIKLMLEQSKFFSPLNDLSYRSYSSGEVCIRDIIMNKCKEETQKKYADYLIPSETSTRKKSLTSGFEAHKSKTAMEKEEEVGSASLTTSIDNEKNKI